MSKLSALSALVLVLAPGAAIAANSVTADCLWASIPAAKRDRVLAAYGASGRDALLDLGKSVKPSGGAILACAGEPNPSKAMSSRIALQAARVWVATMVELSAGEALRGRGVTPYALDQAWSGLTAAQRVEMRRVGEAMLAGRSYGDSSVAVRAVLEAAEAAGWQMTEDGGSTIEPFADYFLTRAAREAAEAQQP